MAQLSFDATRVEPDNGPETVPAGWYIVSADESMIRPTKDGANAYTQFRFSILDGQYKGRKLFARFNLQHANPQTSEIAQRGLSALCHAVNVLQLQDTAQIHDIPLKVRVTVKKDEGYEPSNEIRSYKNINEEVDMSTAAPTAAKAFTPPATNPGFVPPIAAAPATTWSPAAVPAVVAPAVPMAPAVPAAPTFPPQGWTAHPTSPGWFYMGQQVLSEADLRATIVAPAAPAAPAPAWTPNVAQPWTATSPATAVVAPAAAPAAVAPPWAQTTNA